MNTILITGTCKAENNKVRYNVNIWASKAGEQIQLITWQSALLDGYNPLWALAKSKVMGYYNEDVKFDDGAYTQFLDSLIVLPPTGWIEPDPNNYEGEKIELERLNRQPGTFR